MDLIRRISETVVRQGLPLPPSRLLVALSGGADSVALLLILHEMGYELRAAHCNFGLRGGESDRDENFCRRICDRLGIPLHVKHFDTRGEAERTGESIEMAARRLRYGWFGPLADEYSCAAVAVAHHRDDNVETLLLNLLRGSGLRGLTGMRGTNGRIIRPLLGTSRQEITGFLAARGQDYVTDSTNADTVYKRNLVRHELRPLLRRLNPSADETLAATAIRLAEAGQLLDYAVESLRAGLEHVPGGVNLPLPGTDIPTPQGGVRVTPTLIYELLRPYGFTPATVADIAATGGRRSGALYEAPDHVAVVHRGRLEVRPRPVPLPATPVEMPGRTVLPDGTQFEADLLPRAELGCIPRDAATACLDADRIASPLTCRSAAPGDRFAPYGMHGTKLVSDFLTDLHCSRIDRLGARVLCDSEGILWMVGRRPDRRAAITETTRRVLRIKVL